jgi:GTPase KRas protein
VRKRKYPRQKKGLTPRAKDTAGQEEYRGLWASQNLKSDAYLLVYDITSRHSLSALDYFNDLIEIEAGAADEYGAGNAVPHVKIVAGNKCDLADVRQVSAEEGLRWARNHECGFMETSARNMVNIEETFACKFLRVDAEGRR